MDIRRKITGSAVVAVSGLAAFSIILVIMFVMATIIAGGKDTISWEFLSTAPREGMTAGGIFPAIVGMALRVVIMSIAGVPIGVITAV
jgi:phosphate transport system permease protein